uniref:SH3 domain-containing protein n=1 Tax=uncultured prokaryote TaxID=198431 RepID=A0A0H5Q661_9ZZZZ|nr:hypothetical protein [uncultured prokaryote]
MTTRILLHPTGRPVQIGDTITSFRGEQMQVTGWPNDGWNRVWVIELDGQPGEYFPSVFNLKWDDAE